MEIEMSDKLPTHFCKTCFAAWIKHQDGTWSLASASCGECCDNAAMGDQIEAIDYGDDWMFPPARQGGGLPQPKYPRFLILRKRRLDHAPFVQWGNWRTFEDSDARDKELAFLRRKYPTWEIKAKDEFHGPLSYN